MTIVQFYDADTKKCTDVQGRKVIDLSPEMLEFVFGIPTRDEVLLTIKEEALGMSNNDLISNKRHMKKNWLEKERKIS